MSLNKKEILLLIDTVDSYDRNLIKGIIKYSRTYTSWNLIRPAPAYRNIGATLMGNEFTSKNISGIIASEYKFTDRIKEMTIPKIAAPYKEIIGGIPNIVTDDAAIGQMGAKYFLSKGFDNFAFYGYEDSFWSKARQYSFQNEINQARLNCLTKNKTQFKSKDSSQKHLKNLAKWLSGLKKPVAIMLCSDDLSFEIMEAARIINARIPYEIAILGVDNDDLICDLCSPSLSSIEHDSYTVGFNTAKMLDQMIKGEHSKNPNNIIGQPHHIVERLSTEVLAIKDPNLLKALVFINETGPSQILTVDCVVNVTCLSRRQLERKFLSTISSGIAKEIHRVKVNHIKYLLFSTNLTFKEIALETGFKNSDNFSRYFKHICKLSPRDYRRIRVSRL